MYGIVTAVKPRIIAFSKEFVLDSTFLAFAICADCSLDEKFEQLEEPCMLSSVQSTFRESLKIVPKVLMVTGKQGGYLPSEIQGLKGWRRRWIHSAITYI